MIQPIHKINSQTLLNAYLSNFQKDTFFQCIDSIITKDFISNPLELIISFISNYENIQLDFISLKNYSIFLLNHISTLIQDLKLDDSLASAIMLHLCIFLSIDDSEIRTKTINILKMMEKKYPQIYSSCSLLEDVLDENDSSNHEV